MAEVSLKHITKIYPNIEKTKKHRFGKKAAEPEKKKSNLKVTDEGVVAVEDFNLDIADREFVVLVGPSGCGKSTTLRMIAGLESISGGELAIDGKVMNEVAPKDRDIAMVFQSYALYPHMTVYDNMAFPLKLRKVPEDQMASPSTSTASPRPSPAASASAWPSAAPSCVTPRSFSWTSPSPTWTPSSGTRCAPRSSSSASASTPPSSMSRTTRPRP